jgi:DNA-binding protein Fis
MTHGAAVARVREVVSRQFRVEDEKLAEAVKEEIERPASVTLRNRYGQHVTHLYRIVVIEMEGVLAPMDVSDIVHPATDIYGNLVMCGIFTLCNGAHVGIVFRVES